MACQPQARLVDQRSRNLMRISTYAVFLYGIGTCCSSATLFGQAMSPEPENSAKASSSIVTYELVQPILRKHCTGCHNDEESRGNLSLSSPEKIAMGSGSGAVVVPGKAEESPLYLVTAHLDNPKMPPNKPRISQRELQLLERWIQTGAESDLSIGNAPSPISKATSEPASQTHNGEMPGRESLWQPLRAFPRKSPFTAIQAIPESNTVCLTGFNQLCWYDLSSKSFVNKAIASGQHVITGLQWSPDDRTLWMAQGIPSEMGEIVQLDIDSAKVLRSIGRESDTIASFDLSIDKNKVAIGTRNKRVNVYSTSSGGLLYSIAKHTDWVTTVAFSHDGFLLASADRFGTIHVWDANSGAEFATLRGHVGTVTSLIWSENGEQLYSAGWDGYVRVWDLHQATKIDQWLAQPKGILGMKTGSSHRFVRSPDVLVTHGRDGDVIVWDVHAKKAISTLHFPNEMVQLAIIPKTTTPNAKVSEVDSLVGTEMIAADSLGNLFEIDWKTLEEPVVSELKLPLEQAETQVSLRRPPSLVRRLSQTSDNTELASSNRESDSAPPIPSSEVNRSRESAQQADFDLRNNEALTTDLADARRALESIQRSKKALVASLSELEETETRIKQLILMQETRLKQIEWQQRLPQK
jgi:WD40 repeat protein